MNNKNNSKDNGYTSILYAIGTKRLQNWDFSVKNDHIKRILDADIQSLSIEIIGANVDSNYIYIPQVPKKSLGIKMHIIVLLNKNLQKYFEFSVNIMKEYLKLQNFKL